jgi:seryl-tRNA synthetase
MLDRRFIRENPEAVKAAARVKGIDLDVDELLRLDQQTRELQRETDEANTRRKSIAKNCARRVPSSTSGCASSARSWPSRRRISSRCCSWCR